MHRPTRRRLLASRPGAVARRGPRPTPEAHRTATDVRRLSSHGARTDAHRRTAGRDSRRSHALRPPRSRALGGKPPEQAIERSVELAFLLLRFLLSSPKGICFCRCRCRCSCFSFCHPRRGSAVPAFPPQPCHLDRSEAKWRDLLPRPSTSTL